MNFAAADVVDPVPTVNLEAPLDDLRGQLDFIANESLLRGLVTFAALGLIVVHRSESEADEEGEEIDPIAPYVKRPPLVSATPWTPPVVPVDIP